MASTSDKQQIQIKKQKNTKFPVARIKKIMQMDVPILSVIID